MIGKGDLFCTMDDSNKSKITLGDEKAIQVEGMGDMEVSTNEGNKRVNDVYFIPKLKHNLLSVGKIMEKNYKVVFEDRKCMIFDKNKWHKHVTNISMIMNRLFPLIFGVKFLKFDNVTIDDKSWIWNLRYGHLTFASLKNLIPNKMVYGIPKVEDY